MPNRSYALHAEMFHMGLFITSYLNIICVFEILVFVDIM
jgi:hypothetical protein